MRDARRFVRSTLKSWAVAEGDSVLLVSELATNAVLHARTSYTVAITTLGPGAARVAVSDDDPTPPTADLNGSDYATGGRGLMLLRGLARRWGCDTGGGCGKTVWFEV